MVGTSVSHYQIVAPLGAGGMGIVYRARDTKLGRTIALKFLPATVTGDPEARARFIREAQATSALQHNNICTIHDIDETADGQMYIVMDCYEGDALKTLIGRGPLKLADAVDIALQVAQGLSEAHAHGIVHRDIKPGNILLTTGGVVKIVDFGLAKLSGRSMLTREGASLGTLAYMSPEQLQGEPVDHRTDIWALGAVLYEMIAGRTPFAAEYENAVVYGILNAAPEPLTALRTGVPIELERIVAKALAKSPAERYQHMDDLRVDLTQVCRTLAGQRQSAMPAGTGREAGAAVGAQETDAVAGARVTAGHAPRTDAPSVPARRGWLRSPRSIALGAGALLLLAAGLLILKPLLVDDMLVSEPKPVAVIPFINQTGDPSLDYLRDAIPNLLITSLEQSKYLRVVTWERMADVLKQMGKENVDRIDKELGFELCRREGIHAIVLGSFVRAGESYATDVKVLDVGSKELLKSVSARGDGVGSILSHQIDELSKEISRGVGLSERRIATTSRQIADVTTSSMDAYNAYLQGRDEFDRVYMKEALVSFQKAVALDSTFALAYYWLSETYAYLNRDERIPTLSRARALSWRAAEKERLQIEMRYASVVEKDRPKQLELLKQMTSKFPDEKRFYVDLALYYGGQKQYDLAHSAIGKAVQLDPGYAAAINQEAYMFMWERNYERAIENLRRYSALAPGDANPFDSMGELYVRLGRYDDAIASYEKTLAIKPDFGEASLSIAYIHALREDYATALRLLQERAAQAATAPEKFGLHFWHSFFSFWAGKRQEARAEMRILSDLQEKAPSAFLSVGLALFRTWQLYEEGDFDGFQAGIRNVSKMPFSMRSSNPVSAEIRLQSWLGLADVRAARLDSARSRLTRCKEMLPTAEPSFREWCSFYTSTLEGEVLLAEGKAGAAVEVLRAMVRPPLPAMNTGSLAVTNLRIVEDGLARAYEQQGARDSAIAEYERLVSLDPQRRGSHLIHPDLHYKLARLYERAGMRDKAAAEYARFLAIRGHADRSLPEPADARKRLALLTGK